LLRHLLGAIRSDRAIKKLCKNWNWFRVIDFRKRASRHAFPRAFDYPARITRAGGNNEEED
jgi:hypothetical protein